jgi:hypothetical protein
MLFLAGHGHAEGTDYYFLPHDVDSRTHYDLESTAVHKERLRRGLRELFHRSARVMAFFDTCYAGAAFEGGRSDLPPDMDVLAAELKEEANGVIVFTSCTGREIAREDEKWENGAFTEALLEAFSGQIVFDGQDHLRLSHLQTYLPDRVNALTGGQQNPRIYVPFERLWEAPIALLR